MKIEYSINKENIEWFGLIIISLISIVFSFSILGLPYYPYLDSDIAVQVYQAEDFNFPRDLYYWNQDRLGSIVPLLASILKGLIRDMPAIWAVSLVKYLFLLGTCIIGTSLIKSTISRILFVLFLCFPTYEMRYLLLVGHPYIEQMFFVLLSLLLLNKIIYNKKWKLLLVLAFTQSIALWISDFSALMLVSFIIVPAVKLSCNLGFKWVKYKQFFKKLDWKLVYAYLIISLLFLVCILVLKNIVGGDPAYFGNVLVNKREFFKVFSTLFLYIKNVFTLNSISYWNTLMLFLYILVVVMVLVHAIRFTMSEKNLTLLVSFILCFQSTSILHWVAINHVMIKYYIPTLVLMMLFLLVCIDYFGNRYKRYVQLLVSLIVFSSFQVLNKGLSLKFDDIHTYSELRSVISLPRPIYIVGDYWNSYVYGIAYPESIICTPDDSLTARNKEFYNLIRRENSIYVSDKFYDELGNDSIIFLFDGTKYKKSEESIYYCGGSSFHGFVKYVSY